MVRDGQTLDFMLSERRNLAAATIAGIEAAHMIRKGQIAANGASACQIFAGLAA